MSFVINPYDINAQLEKLSLLKHSPGGLMNLALNRVKDITDGKVEITDPNTPLAYLLETSCVNTALAIQEFTLCSRKLYPKLANTSEDLQRHMSDYDYADAFAQPAYAGVTFSILYNDFITKGYLDVVEGEYTFTIPRNFKVEIDKYIFTLPQPIVVKKYRNGVLDVKFDATKTTALFPLQANNIAFDIYSTNQSERYLNFTVQMPEIDIELIDFTVTKSSMVKQKVTYNPARKFHYAEAYYLVDGEWVTMAVAHGEEVYDINTPTVCLNVDHQTTSLTYYIPPMFVDNNRVTGKVKLLIYTTTGAMKANFDNFKVGDFSTSYNGVFPSIELDDTTKALGTITKAVYIRGTVVGGRDMLSFDDLKAIVINGSVGDRQLPITSNQLDKQGLVGKFRIIRDVDIITQRVFGLEVTLPRPATRYPISKINLDLITLKSTLRQLATHPQVAEGDDGSLIIPEGCLFSYGNGKLAIPNAQAINKVSSGSGETLAEYLTTTNYLSTYYHYVVNIDETDCQLHAYDLNSADVLGISFEEYNSSTKVGVNTRTAVLTKTTSGFRLLLDVNYKKYVNNITFLNITPCLIYIDKSGGKFFLSGSLHSDDEVNPYFKFDILTDKLIDSNGKLVTTNFTDNNGMEVRLPLELLVNLKLVYFSDTVPADYYVSDTTNTLLLPGSNPLLRFPVTLETIKLRFADALTNLYSPLHSSVSTATYQTYLEDVPLRYKKNVYNPDNTVLHYAGEIVMSDSTPPVPVIQFRKGDVMLDASGNPMATANTDLTRYLTLLLIDHRAVVGNRTELVTYKQDLRQFLTSAIVTEASQLQLKLLERTEGKVTVPKTLSDVSVTVNNSYTATIPNAQSFIVDVFISDAVNRNSQLKEKTEYEIISTIDSFLETNAVLRKTELLEQLWIGVKTHAISVAIPKFTELNEEYLVITSPNSRLTIKKQLVYETGRYNLKEDVIVNFRVM